MITLQGGYYAHLHVYKCGTGRSERLSTLSDITELGSANVCLHNLCSVHSSVLLARMRLMLCLVLF